MGVITFNNITSSSLGIEVETFPDYVAPEKEYQVTHIPGRNGDLVVDTKTFQNVPRSYDVSVATNGVPIDVVNAAVARFKSGSRMPIKSLKSEITAVQDLHGYDHPWPAGGGENLLPEATAGTFTKSGMTVVSDGKGSYRFYGTATASVEITMPIEEVTLPDTVFIHLMNRSVASQCALVLAYDGTQIFAPAMVVANRIMDISEAAGGKTINNLKFYINNGYTVDVTLSPMLCVDNTIRSFSPYSNICPITGFDSGVVSVSGKNLYNKTTVTIGKYVTNTGTEHPTTSGSHSDYIPIKKNVPYYFSHIVGLDSFYSVAVYDENKTFIECINLPGSYDVSGMLTFTRGTYIKVNVNIRCIDICQIELGTSATEYTPFVASDAVIFQFGQTVYGGHFDNKGNLVVTHHFVDLGSLTFGLGTGGNARFTAQLPLTPITPQSATAIGDITSDIYTTASSGDVYSGSGNYLVAIHTNGLLWIRNTDYSDANAFKTAMSGYCIVYALANPITLSIPSQTIFILPGENTIFSNTGDVSVKVEPSFSTIINQVAEWLHSASGYARLEDTYEPDYYRMAYYSESVSVENLFNEAGKATLNFICKPQRYLKSGETPVVFTEEGTIQNGTRFSSSPVLKVTTDNTQGSVSIGNHSITIKAGVGTDPITIDCELQDAWSGTSNKNSYIVLTDGEFPVIDPGTQTVTFDGGVQSVEVIPRWWTV